MRKYRSPIVELASSGKQLAPIPTPGLRIQARGEQLAARFQEQLAEQPNYLDKLYNFWKIFTKNLQNSTKQI